MKKQNPSKTCSEPSGYSPSSGFNLTFGIYLDGADWSDKPASLGEVKLGPLGMLNLLETHLGLTAPAVHPARRINQYMNRLKMQDNPDSWYHSSFAADPWSTAKQILAWRDELIQGGWKGQTDSGSSLRLRTLSALEQVGLPLSKGREDRLQQVLLHLEKADSPAIDHIALVEDLEILPPIWKKVFARLQEIGVKVESLSDPLHKQTSSNLTHVRKALSGVIQSVHISEKDDSLILVKAADEWDAAENLALWLSADTEANKDVTIICGSDTDVLDQALQSHGLPKLGFSESSRWCASLQVLPLVLANSWKPVDVRRLLELLSLTMAPVPRFAARLLLKAIGKEPGVGGDAWTEALEAIAVEREKRLLEKGSANPASEAKSFVEKLNAFLSTDRYSPDSGIPEEKLKERCQWVAEWLSFRVEDDPMLVEAVSHATEMQKLAEGKKLIPRVAVERMLDSVIGIGSSAPDRFEQAAPWRVLDHPGQITSSCGTIVWWGFNYPSTNPAAYWSDTERKSLKQFGVELESSTLPRRREAIAWKKAINGAEDHLLLFCPAYVNGEPVPHHPLWDEIQNAAFKLNPKQKEEEILACLIRESVGLVNKGAWQLAGRKTSLCKTDISAPKPPSAAYLIPKNSISPPEHLSYSQMNTMLGCPMKWTLQYHAGLKMPESLTLPTGNQMIGSLCHSIVQKLYENPPRPMTPASAEALALKLYDRQAASMGSELLLEGREIENMRYRAAIGKAVRQLVEAISQHGLTVEETEKELEGMMGTTPFKGFADLVLRDKDGNRFVIDMKWTSSSKYLKKALEEGEALQLAIYAWLLRSAAPSTTVHSGYFMLAQGDFLSDSPLLGEEALDSKYPLDKIWDRGVRSWNSCFKSLNDGTMEASGVKESLLQSDDGLDEDAVQAKIKDEYDSNGLLYQSPPCRICNFANLCGMSGGEK